MLEGVLGATWQQASRDPLHHGHRRGPLRWRFAPGRGTGRFASRVRSPQVGEPVRFIRHTCATNSTNNVDYRQVALFESRRPGTPVAGYRGSRVGFLRFAEKTREKGFVPLAAALRPTTWSIATWCIHDAGTSAMQPLQYTRDQYFRNVPALPQHSQTVRARSSAFSTASRMRCHDGMS